MRLHRCPRLHKITVFKGAFFILIRYDKRIYWLFTYTRHKAHVFLWFFFHFTNVLEDIPYFLRIIFTHAGLWQYSSTTFFLNSGEYVSLAPHVENCLVHSPHFRLCHQDANFQFLRTISESQYKQSVIRSLQTKYIGNRAFYPKLKDKKEIYQKRIDKNNHSTDDIVI